MSTYCAPLVADLSLFCYEKDTIIYLSDDVQADIIDVFNTTFRYLDDSLNINNTYIDYMVSQMHLSEIWLYAAYASDTKVSFWDLNLSIRYDIVSTKFTFNVTVLLLKLSFSNV